MSIFLFIAAYLIGVLTAIAGFILWDKYLNK